MSVELIVRGVDMKEVIDQVLQFQRPVCSHNLPTQQPETAPLVEKPKTSKPASKKTETPVETPAPGHGLVVDDEADKVKVLYGDVTKIIKELHGQSAKYPELLENLDKWKADPKIQLTSLKEANSAQLQMIKDLLIEYKASKELDNV